MAYAPVARGSVPLKANDNVVDGTNGIADNHNTIYVVTTPSVVEHAFEVDITGASVRDIYRWRLRGNRDAQSMTAHIRASSAGAGASSMTLRVDTDSAGTGAITADGWYDVAGAPAVSRRHDCALSVDVAAATTLTLSRLTAYLEPSASPGRARNSRWVYHDTSVSAADDPVTVEHLDRWQRGPLQIRGERPSCVVCHLSTIKTGSPGKSALHWSAASNDAFEVVGMALMPKCSDETRPYHVDVYMSRPSGSGEVKGAIQIGSAVLDVTAVDGWSEFDVSLPRGPLPVSALLKVAAGTSAQFDCVQIWTWTGN